MPLRFQIDVDTMPEAPTRRALLKRAGLDPARYDLVRVRVRVRIGVRVRVRVGVGARP